MISKQNIIAEQMHLLIAEVSNSLSNERALNIVYNFLLVHVPPTVAALRNTHAVGLGASVMELCNYTYGGRDLSVFISIRLCI